MDERKLRSAMGFAMKAGKCSAGDFVCEKLVRTGRARAILLDSEASEKTRERYERLCEKAGIPCLSIKDMGAPIGKSGRMIAAITDDGFAKMIITAYGEPCAKDKDTGVE